MKVCKNCGEEKPLSDYYKRVASKDRLAFNCKPCSNEIASEWSKRNVDKRFETRRKSHLRRKFGISLEQYSELLKKQKYSCAVCERHVSEFDKELAVDHNHATQEIRGLLCTYCNHRVVGRHTNGELLRRVADYVEQGTGWFAPKQKKTVKRKPKRK